MKDNSALEVSHRKVWLLAGPIILSNISTPLVGAVDTAVVGHLPGLQAIGAVAIGALIFSFLYWGFGFLRMGTTGFIAQAVGAGDGQEISDTLLRALSLAVVLGLLAILISWSLIDLALLLINSSVAIESLALEYSQIRLWSAPAVLCVYVFTGVLIGMHNTRDAFLLQLMLNLINVGLDLIFVMGFDWGVTGVASASVVAEYSAMLFGAYLLRGTIRNALNDFNRQRLWQKQALIKLFAANANIFIRTLCLIFAFSYFTAQSAKMGEVVLAANTILLHFFSFAAYGLDGFAHAAEAMSGSAYGAAKRQLFHRVVSLTTLWSLFLATLFSVVYWLLGDAIIGLFTNIDEIKNVATEYLPWLIVLPFVSLWSFQLDGIFIGCSHTRAMRNAMVVSLAAYLLLLWFSIPALGNHGLYLGLTVFMLVRALSLLFYYPGIVSAIKTAAPGKSV